MHRRPLFLASSTREISDEAQYRRLRRRPPQPRLGDVPVRRLREVGAIPVHRRRRVGARRRGAGAAALRRDAVVVPAAGARAAAHHQRGAPVESCTSTSISPVWFRQLNLNAMVMMNND